MAGTPAIKALQQANIVFSEHTYLHDPRKRSFGLEAVEALGCDPADVFKTLICLVDESPVVAIVPALMTVELKALAKAAKGRKVSLASVVDAQRWSGYHVGGVSPIGQRNSHPTFLDSSAMTRTHIYVSGGQRGLEIRLQPVDLILMTDAVVCDLGRDGIHPGVQRP